MLFTEIFRRFFSSCFYSFPCQKVKKYIFVYVKVPEIVFYKFDSIMGVYLILCHEDKISEISHTENCIVAEYLVSASHS